MSEAQQLIFAMYVAFAALVYLAGYIYKKRRDRRDRKETHEQPSLPFGPERRHTERRGKESEQHDFAAAGR
jgi:hypothetical protein